MNPSVSSAISAGRPRLWASRSFICPRCRQKASVFIRLPKTHRSISYTPRQSAPVNPGTSLKPADDKSISQALQSPPQDLPSAPNVGKKVVISKRQDWFRRKIWGEEEAARQDMFIVEGEEDRPKKPASRLNQDTTDPDYKPAQTWDGLERVGGPTGWWEEQWDREHQYLGFMRPEYVIRQKSIAQCINRAICEIYTLKQHDLPLHVRTPLYRSFDFRYKMWRREDGHVEARWFDHSQRQEALMVITESMEDLRRRDEDEALEQEAARLENELGANAGPSAEETKTTVNSDEQAPHQTEISQVGIAEAEPEPEFEPDAEGGMDEVSNEPTLDDSMASFSPGGKEIILDPKSGVFPMKFENEEIRFAILKRVMQLVGRRLPDPTIAHLYSTNNLLAALAKKEKPKTTSDALKRIFERDLEERKRSSVTKFNVNIRSKKYDERVQETEVGRQKVIDQALDRAGLHVPYREILANVE